MEIKDILDLKESKFLTAKAKFLYKQGLYEEEQTLTEFEAIEMHDVTYGNGFGGFDVYERENGGLLLVKTTSSDEGNIYNYTVIDLGNVTDEEFVEAYEYAESIKKFTPLNVLKWTTIVSFILGTISFLIILITVLAGAAKSGYSIVDILTGLIDYILPYGALAALTTLVVKKL